MGYEWKVPDFEEWFNSLPSKEREQIPTMVLGDLYTEAVLLLHKHSQRTSKPKARLYKFSWQLGPYTSVFGVEDLTNCSGFQGGRCLAYGQIEIEDGDASIEAKEFYKSQEEK